MTPRLFFDFRTLLNLQEGFCVIRVYDPIKPYKPVDFTIVDLDSFLAVFSKEAKQHISEKADALCTNWNAEFENSLPVSLNCFFTHLAHCFILIR